MVLASMADAAADGISGQCFGLGIDGGGDAGDGGHLDQVLPGHVHEGKAAGHIEHPRAIDKSKSCPDGRLPVGFKARHL